MAAVPPIVLLVAVEGLLREQRRTAAQSNPAVIGKPIQADRAISAISVGPVTPIKPEPVAVMVSVEAAAANLVMVDQPSTATPETLPTPAATVAALQVDATGQGAAAAAPEGTHRHPVADGPSAIAPPTATSSAVPAMTSAPAAAVPPASEP